MEVAGGLARAFQDFLINENGDYFWLDRGHGRIIWRFMLIRAGLSGGDTLPHLGDLLVLPFTFTSATLCRAGAFQEVVESAMKAVFVTDPGGVDKLRYADLPMPKPGPGEALVKIHAAGVNFIDIYYRTGLYKAEPPVVLGLEGAGVVEQAGEGSTGVAAGDRVAWAMARGSYAEYAAVPAWQLVKVPDDLSLEVAAGSMLQGMTAHYLTHSTYALKSGDTALIHAAAGGAGQWTVAAAKLRGARVIGTVSTKEKAEVARQAGCDEVILYTEQDFEKEVKRLTGGQGVDVVYDSVGKATWERSLNSLKPRGVMVSFGNASGPVDRFNR